MRLRRKTKTTETPPIFADLVLDVHGKIVRVDVERKGWLEDARKLYRVASRAGLILRGKDAPSVWIAIKNGEVEYLSRVIGALSMQGNEHKRIRVAGLLCGDQAVWLHNDGLVEVQSEPTAWRK